MKCPKCDTVNPDDSRFCKDCGTNITSAEEAQPSITKTIETPREELTTGSKFAGRYQIIEELGKGGMGKVYKVLDTETNEKIALKLIKPEIASDKNTVERFRNELTIARRIVQKNVCRMYDLNIENDSYYITMEYVEGQDLKKLIRQTGQLAIGTLINIAKQVCDGLVEAHRLGVVHRDLKPSNIMIDADGNARIMDFGIARSMEGKGITGAGVMIGTPEYMSPEQVEGKEVDLRSDIYSLGVILYEMVTGKVPFEGDTPFTIGVKHKSEIPKDPKELNTQIPEDLSSVILRCLEKVNEKRYQSAGEVRSELANIEKGIPTTEREVTKVTPATSKEITVTFSPKKLFIPTLVVITLVIMALIIWKLWLQKDAVPLISEKPSIAVLPFADLSPQKDQEYFCDGLAEELINRLSNIENLRIPARASAFSFKGKDLDYREIGESLNVEMILDGSVRKAGDKLRITVQMVKASDSYPIWSKIYERNIEDTFALQDAISLAIVDKLRVTLLGGEKEKLIKRPTENLMAFTLYLKGRSLWNKRGAANIKKALEFFELAIEEDPSYSLAYTGVADSYSILVGNWSIPHKEGYPKAREAALKALELDNTLAEAHTSLAGIKFLDWDWEGAERGFKQAIELNPGYATAHHMYSWYLIKMARYEEAITEIKLATSLDPLTALTHSYLGYVLFCARHYDQAIETQESVLKMFPNNANAHWLLGQVYLGKSMYEEALVEFQIIDHSTWIGITYAKMGKKEEALKKLNDILNASKKRNIRPIYLALIYFALDERDKGFEWLVKGFEERDSWTLDIKTDPIFDNIRSDPRYKALLQKMNLD
ncbi:protein kinase [Acidobacteriota bacterium]